MVTAARFLGFVSPSDFDELTPAALDALIEGRQKAELEAYNWKRTIFATSLFPVMMVGENGPKEIDDQADKIYQKRKATIIEQHQQVKAPSKENISAIERYQAFLSQKGGNN